MGTQCRQGSTQGMEAYDRCRRKKRLMATASADVPLKGLIYLIRAYNMLLADHPDLELVVVGRLREGQTMDELNHKPISNERLASKLRC